MSSRAFNIADHMKNLQGTRTLASGAKIVGADADSIQAPGLITTAGGGDNTSLNTGLASATFPAGHVIQVTFGSTSTEVGSTNNTYKDTGLTATITPSSQSSKIAIFMNVNGIQKETNNAYMDLKAVYNINGGSFIDIAQFGARLGMTNDSSKNNVGTCAFNHLLSPNTEHAVIVKAQFRSAANNSGVGVQEASSTSTLMLMEIAG